MKTNGRPNKKMFFCAFVAMERILFERRSWRSWNGGVNPVCRSGGSDTPIDKVVARATLNTRGDFAVGNISQTKDIFVHLLYLRDYEETVRRVMLTSDPGATMAEVLDAIHNFARKPEMMINLIRAAL